MSIPFDVPCNFVKFTGGSVCQSPDCSSTFFNVYKENDTTIRNVCGHCSTHWYSELLLCHTVEEAADCEIKEEIWK